MNPIKKAVDDIRFRIPRSILNLVFQDQTFSWRNSPISLDEQIINKVIRPKVLVDCNLVGGAEIFVPLDGVPSEMTSDYTTVYYIPKEKTQNRSINTVLSMSYLTGAAIAALGGTTGFNSCSMTPSMIAAQAMMSSFSNIPPVSTANISLIGENTILVRDTAPPIGFGFLRCILENDDQMSHLQLRSIPDFSTLCTLACKAYIYNEYIVTLDRGQLYGGQDIGVVKQIIDGYADTSELYEAFLREKWQKISFMNDRESMTRMIKLQIGGMR
jgi:hypothetical protein